MRSTNEYKVWLIYTVKLNSLTRVKYTYIQLYKKLQIVYSVYIQAELHLSQFIWHHTKQATRIYYGNSPQTVF